MDFLKTAIVLFIMFGTADFVAVFLLGGNSILSKRELLSIALSVLFIIFLACLMAALLPYYSAIA